MYNWLQISRIIYSDTFRWWMRRKKPVLLLPLWHQIQHNRWHLYRLLINALLWPFKSTEIRITFGISPLLEKRIMTTVEKRQKTWFDSSLWANATDLQVLKHKPLLLKEFSETSPIRTDRLLAHNCINALSKMSFPCHSHN